MSDAVPEFAALLDRARRGDPGAVEQLAKQYESKIRLVARVQLGPALRPYLDSIDVVQSVHRSLMAGLRDDKFDIAGPEQLLALVLTMVRRKVARQWRHMQRQQRLAHGPADSGNLPAILASLCSPETDPARAAQLNEAVERLCANLDSTERNMLDMRLQGYSTGEIADNLGIHAIALRVRLTRLRQRLAAGGVLNEWL
jgi:RNA polymerase sigma-70 factor (ECF subfamily)